MDDINHLFQINLPSLLLSCFALLAGFLAIMDMVGRLSELIGKPVAWMRRHSEDHSLLIQTSQSLMKLEKKQPANKKSRLN